MLGRRSRRTLSSPTSVAAVAAAAPSAAQTPSAIRRIAGSRASRTAGSNARVVPRSTTSSGITFQVSPPWIWVTLTTAPSSGWMLRLAIVCKPVTNCAGADRELPGRQARPVVHAVDRIHLVAVEDALFDHQPRAAFIFLGRLEDEMDGAGEVARLGEVFGGAEQHRGVAVMAAGMHPAMMLRGVRETGFLLDRQGVHIGAQY